MSVIPKHAKKVFDGVIFDVFQWDQEMYDGTTAVFERARKTYSSMVIPYVDGKIIITKQQQPSKAEPYYALIGGRVEKNETPLENAHKELREEAGLECPNLTEIAEFENGFNLDYKCFLYLAKDCIKVGEQQLDSGEKIELMSVSADEFMNMLKTNKLQESRMLKLMFENEMSEACANRIRGKITF